MSYIENIDNEISSGKISKKEGLELKTHYNSLDNSDRADVVKRFSTNQNSSNSNLTIEDVPIEKKDNGILINNTDTVDDIINKYKTANPEQKKSFIALLKGYYSINKDEKYKGYSKNRKSKRHRW